VRINIHTQFRIHLEHAVKIHVSLGTYMCIIIIGARSPPAAKLCYVVFLSRRLLSSAWERENAALYRRNLFQYNIHNCITDLSVHHIHREAYRHSMKLYTHIIHSSFPYTTIYRDVHWNLPWGLLLSPAHFHVSIVSLLFYSIVRCCMSYNR
jgi:hypothetical protein